jgi:hypothetical protein
MIAFALISSLHGWPPCHALQPPQDDPVALEGREFVPKILQIVSKWYRLGQ